MCNDPVQRDFFNTGGVAGRNEFEYICSHCGASPAESPMVADAVLGIAPDGKKLLPICESCHERGVKLRGYGKADQAKARQQTAGTKRKEREARGSGSGNGRGRRGRRGEGGASGHG
mmetsp:Transcript_50029/g.106919  ORF Transcript_50029/g.106919 Transcript_50029/m.106919 type:complete len:117 (-) Transcript_50029:294-644(-)